MVAPAPRPARRVLVVEDSPENRELLHMVLEAWGYEVQTAGDGLQGVGKALAWEPDAAVVDIRLPVLDGYEVARRVRAALGPVLLIALTGYTQHEDRRRAYDAGFDHHLAKPADPAVLARLLWSAGEGV